MEKTQTIDDVIDPARIAALNATLGLSDLSPQPFAHQIFFWIAAAPQALGRDGHPKTGAAEALIPDLGLPRRMWAGGDLSFHAALQPAQPARKTTRLAAQQIKQGRSGRFALITLSHEIYQGDTLCLTERQDLVYRSDDAAPGATRQAPSDEDHRKSHRFTTTELFRYSALTFNGHRIHYDRDYAMSVEGYGGLVVHGPLLAQYLMLMAQSQLGTLRNFQFRATSPLMDFEPAQFCLKTGAPLSLWVRAPDGRLCMTATAS